MTQSSIQQLQLFQQNLQHLTQQKQLLETQLLEIDSALEELQHTEKSYKILGKIMVAVSQPKLTADLQNKKEILQLRLQTLEKQETLLTQNIEKAQQEVVHELKKK